MPRKTNGFRNWVGSQWRKISKPRANAQPALAPSSAPAPPDASPARRTSLSERLEARFEDMMQEIDELSQEQHTLEDHAEYGWIVLVRIALPFVFFLGFGYEDGLFMTGFRYLSWEPFILLMYVIGYGLEGLRVAMVYSMNFSKGQGRTREYRAQFVIWLVMSLGCGVAQLASALVIQALGADKNLTDNNALAQGAHVILSAIPWLVYLAIGIRVGLCGIADWACSGHLFKRKQTAEQKVAEITKRAENVITVVQAQLNAQSMVDNARQFQQMVSGQRQELEELRTQQKTVFDVVFGAGMRQIRRVTNIEEAGDEPPMLSQPGDE